MIEYPAGGLAIITGLEGKLRRLIHDAGCGYTYASQDVEDLKSVILFWAPRSACLNSGKWSAFHPVGCDGSCRWGDHFFS